jgi:N-acetylglucosamine-6-phosphate deacetylase
VRNCVRLLGLSLEEALRLASVNPAAFLGIKAGRLAPGFRADMIAFEPRDIEVLRTWIAGTEPDAAD